MSAIVLMEQKTQSPSQYKEALGLLLAVDLCSRYFIARKSPSSDDGAQGLGSERWLVGAGEQQLLYRFKGPNHSNITQDNFPRQYYLIDAMASANIAPDSSFTARKLNRSTFLIAEKDAYREHPLIYVKVHPTIPVVIIGDTGCDRPSKSRAHGE